MANILNKEVSHFAELIEGKQLPIERSDALLFGEALKDFHAPSGLLLSLVGNMYFIGENEFRTTLQRLTVAAEPFTQDPYYFFTHHMPGSGEWVYQEMCKLGLRPAERLINGIEGANAEYDKKKYSKNYTPLVPTGMRSVIIDDFSLGGAQIRELEDTMFETFGVEDPSILLGYVTELASANLSEFPFTAVKTIPVKPMRQTLSIKRAQYLNELQLRMTNGNEWLSVDDFLFWTYYKIPDNLPAMYTGSFLPPLIRKERFHPDYRPA